MNKWIAVLLLAAMPAIAQKKEGCEPPPNAVRKIIQVQNLQASSVAELGRGLGLCVTYDNVGKLVAVSGAGSGVSMLEETLKRLDTRPRAPQVEFVGYLLRASNAALEEPGTAVPPALDPVMQQLRSIFPYKSYDLADTMMTRISATGRYGNASLNGRLANRSMYGLEITVSDVQPPPDGRVTFERIGLQIREEGANQGALNISTSTSIRDGQKVVIGKANSNKLGEAYFFVVTIKLVD